MNQERQVEQYGFYCKPCDYEWRMSYEVRTVAQSDERQYLYLHGLPATHPTAGRLCPNCWTPSFSCQKLDEPAFASSHH